MSDVLEHLREEVSTWPAPAKDLPAVVHRGRRRSLIRKVGVAALCLAVLAAGFVAFKSWDGGNDIPPAGSSFDIVQITAERNGVTLEPATPGDGWYVSRSEAEDSESLLPDGPVPVLVTAPKLGRGLDAVPAWANLIDGSEPGLMMPNEDGTDPSAPRVSLTLSLMGGDAAYVPAAPPYEWWSNDEHTTEPTYEPLPVTASLRWEGFSIEHPINWRRLTEDYDPGGSVTRLASVIITNMSGIPPGWGQQNAGDLKDAPSDAVVVELNTFEGGPQGVDDCATRETGCEGIVTSVSETIDYVGNRHGSFSVGNVHVSYWVGRDASEEEVAAFERMRDSIEAKDGPPEELAEEEVAPRRCNGQRGQTADVNGDGQDELVYHAFVKGRAQVGVCFSDGTSDTIPGLGQAESMTVMREEVVDKDVVLFGATGITDTTYNLAIWKGGSLRVVQDARTLEPLTAHSGLEPPNGIGWAWGWNCDRINAPGSSSEVHGMLVQVKVIERSGRLHWTARGYNWRNTNVATNDSSRQGSTRGGDPVKYADRLVQDCRPT